MSFPRTERIQLRITPEMQKQLDYLLNLHLKRFNKPTSVSAIVRDLIAQQIVNYQRELLDPDYVPDSGTRTDQARVIAVRALEDSITHLKNR